MLWILYFLLFVTYLSDSVFAGGCIPNGHRCEIDTGRRCCGFPFSDCINDFNGKTCKSLFDYPEVMAEYILEVREATEKGGEYDSLKKLRQHILEGNRKKIYGQGTAKPDGKKSPVKGLLI